MEQEWDIFISHASEDKVAVARPLSARLKRLGLKVWFDESELKLGDSLSRKIDEGLAISRAGVVVLSRNFFEKNWPEYELRGLTAKAVAGMGSIIPVWHEITLDEIIRYSPTLGDTFAGNSNDSLDALALKIVSAVRPDLHRAIMRKITALTRETDQQTTKIAASQINIGPIRHISLARKMVERIDLIRFALLDVMPSTRAEWVEGFQRDTHPWNEVEIWENIAARYIRAALGLSLNQADKSSVFSALLIYSLNGAEDAVEILIDKFGERANLIVDSMKFDSSIFSLQTEEDRAFQMEMNFEIQALAGPEVAIDISYLEELIAERMAKSVVE